MNSLPRLATALLTSLATAVGVYAADDPSITDPLRSRIQEAMASHIETQQAGGAYLHYDAVAGELLRLELVELHAGIVHKGDFFVSCADFRTPAGDLVDLDFLVLPLGDDLEVTQAIVHKRHGEQRPYHLEEAP